MFSGVCVSALTQQVVIESFFYLGKRVQFKNSSALNNLITKVNILYIYFK